MRNDKTLTMLKCDKIAHLCTVYMSNQPTIEGYDFIILTERGCMTLQTSFPLSHDYTDALILLKGVLMDAESFYRYNSEIDYIKQNDLWRDLLSGSGQYDELQRICGEVARVFTLENREELKSIIDLCI